MKGYKEKTSVLLSRKEIHFEVEHPGAATPKKAEIKESIAKQYNAAPEKITIKSISTAFGANKSTVVARIYEDEKVMKLVEPVKGQKAAPKQKAAPAKK